MAMAFMVAYSILTLFLGVTILEKEQAKFYPGMNRLKGRSTTSSSSSSSSSIQNHRHEQNTKERTTSTWQRRRHDMLLPSTATTDATIITTTPTTAPSTTAIARVSNRNVETSSANISTKPALVIPQTDSQQHISTMTTTTTTTASKRITITTTSTIDDMKTVSETSPPPSTVATIADTRSTTRSSLKQQNLNTAPVIKSEISHRAKDSTETTATTTAMTEKRKSNRFPIHGTPAFAAACPWIVVNGTTRNILATLSSTTTTIVSTNNNCTILARPPPDSREGLSWWVSQVAVGFIMSQQAGCKFLLDYGKGIDVGTILEPVDQQLMDWRVSTTLIDYDFCQFNVRCFNASFGYTASNQKEIDSIEDLFNDTIQLAYIPGLRNAYTTAQSWFDSMNGFQDLSRTLPGFDIETSMACSLGSLFRLSSRATMYEPTLFSELLPTLHAQDTLVISLYIRTGRTEDLTQGEATSVIELAASRIAECAMQIEKEYVAHEKDNNRNNKNVNVDYARIVWMVVTDSSYLKIWMKKQFTTLNSTFVTIMDRDDHIELPPRSILTTKSRGAHTKREANPSTAFFAEGLLDWYLIGESDAVVGNTMGPSFGDTGAFRTNRPFYKIPVGSSRDIGDSCAVKVPVLRWKRPVSNTDNTVSDNPPSQLSAHPTPPNFVHSHAAPVYETAKTTVLEVTTTTMLATLAKEGDGQDQTSVSETNSNDNHGNDLRSKERYRFPTFGTPEFAKACPWIFPNGTGGMLTTNTITTPTINNCTILARPHKRSGEGISGWVSQVAVGFIMSRQSGCGFRLDYGDGIDVGAILEPTSGLDWRVPATDSDFCHPDANCFLSPWQYDRQHQVNEIETAINGSIKLALVPQLRFPYISETYYLDLWGGYQDLARTIPGFDMETSMACSLGSLFRLSPRAIKYEPTLFTELLPALRSTDSLVLSLYIRTGRAENLTERDVLTEIELSASRIAECAMRIEEEYVKSKAGGYARIVWIVVTDSLHLKSWMRDQYTTLNSTIVGSTNNGIWVELPTRSILTTKSRGAHTKPNRNPSTADFVEGLLDWYLIGESDVVVGDYLGPSFGYTGAFRTNRPFYKVPEGNATHIGRACSLQVPYCRHGRPVSITAKVSGMSNDAVAPNTTITTMPNEDKLETTSATISSLNHNNHARFEQMNHFPAFGTPAFAESCPWIFSNGSRRGTSMTNTEATSSVHSSINNCTILARPTLQSGEGISGWVNQAAVGFIMSLQAGCRFMMDYGKDIDVGTVLEPASIEEGLDWRVPAGNFDFCRSENKCFIATFSYHAKTKSAFDEIAKAIGQKIKLAMVPHLRYPYTTDKDFVRLNKGFRDLARTIPGFELESSMACSLGTLFRLSPQAATYFPSLFTELLPTLHAQDALVMTLYVRTGHAEDVRIAEDADKIEKLAVRFAECAMRIEKEYVALARTGDGVDGYARIVWMVISDSQHVKKWMKNEYATLNSTMVDSTDGGDFIELPPRSILTTASRGAHTKPDANPSTIDFAEALLDWYLIGESNVVVGGYVGPSFGDTAAYRTLRPYYKVPRWNAQCSRQDLVLV